MDSAYSEEMILDCRKRSANACGMRCQRSALLGHGSSERAPVRARRHTHLKSVAVEADMENESPGFHNPWIVVPVARRDLVWNPNLDRSLHFGKDQNPRVVTPILRSALR